MVRLRLDAVLIDEEYAKSSTEGAAMQVESKQHRVQLHDHLLSVSFSVSKRRGETYAILVLGSLSDTHLVESLRSLARW